jgi:hypothetical protein
LATVLLSGLLVRVPVSVSAEEKRVVVTADQTATVIGTFDSLTELLSDLCAKAGVELRSYDAPDHPISASHTERPLSEVIERLLSKENYLLGVRGGRAEGSPMEVAWIRVTGSKGSGDEAVPGGLDVPSTFGETAFDSEDPTDARRAQEAVAARLLANEAQVAQFLKMDPRALAASLRQYPHIDVVLRKLRADQQHPAVVEKLDAVIGELALHVDSVTD